MKIKKYIANSIAVVAIISVLILVFFDGTEKSSVTPIIVETSVDTTPYPTCQVQEEIDKEEIQILTEDICGRITIPGSDIDYPVCQGIDNDYYLSHDIYGNKSQYGSIFLDCYSTADDKNKVIYGHNMGAGSTAMFSTLLYYENATWYQSHRSIKYTNATGETSNYLVFAVFNFDTNKLNEFDYMQRNFNTQHEFEVWVDYIRNNNIQFNDVQVHSKNEILTLSTCNRVYGSDNRFLVFAIRE